MTPFRFNLLLNINRARALLWPVPGHDAPVSLSLSLSPPSLSNTSNVAAARYSVSVQARTTLVYRILESLALLQYISAT